MSSSTTGDKIKSYLGWGAALVFGICLIGFVSTIIAEQAAKSQEDKDKATKVGKVFGYICLAIFIMFVIVLLYSLLKDRLAKDAERASGASGATKFYSDDQDAEGDDDDFYYNGDNIDGNYY